MCNVNFTDVYVPDEDLYPSTTETAPKKSVKPFIYIVAVVTFSIIIVIGLAASIYFWKKNPKKHDLEIGHQHSVPPPTDYSLDKLKLLNIIGKNC